MPRRPRSDGGERVAVTLEGWIGTTVHDGGLGIRTSVVDPLGADVILALTYDQRDGCDNTLAPPPRCRASRLLPALHGPGPSGAPPPAVHVSVSPSLDTAQLLERFEALPHWATILAAHNAPGSPVACPRAAAANDTATSSGRAGYACTGLYKGNSYLAPVLGDPAIHNLHQLHALGLALQLVAQARPPPSALLLSSP